MQNIILGAILAFVITFYAIPVIIQVSNMKKLFDLPGDRKIHLDPVPSLGGLGIFAGFVVALLLMTDLHHPVAADTFQFYLSAFLLVFFFGIKDDILVLTPFKKILGQFSVAAILIFKANLVIISFHGFLGIETLDPMVSYAFSFCTIIVVINAFNLIDGVDGLAGSLGIVTATFFSFFAWMSGDEYYALFGFTFAAALAAFLIYNYSPARIFMGDTGAMLIGVVNAILVIQFINTAEHSRILPVLASPAMGVGVLLIPLFDTLRVFFIRIVHGRSPFSPDRLHIHHILLDKGLSHMSITLWLSLANITVIILSFLLLPLGTTKVIALQAFLFYGALAALRYNKNKAKGLQVIKGESGDEDSDLSEETLPGGQIRPKVRQFRSFTQF
jgi:UDP-GlcNAc:undecaprenyl-phosphate/decaprenyl-phosphate GlcNAc-1-phosphate transferase